MRPGQVVQVPDKIAENWIREGYAEFVDGSVPRKSEVAQQKSIRLQSSTPVPHMMPPRYICRCGFVAKDEESLAEHQKEC